MNILVASAPDKPWTANASRLFQETCSEFGKKTGDEIASASISQDYIARLIAYYSIKKLLRLGDTESKLQDREIKAIKKTCYILKTPNSDAEREKKNVWFYDIVGWRVILDFNDENCTMTVLYAQQIKDFASQTALNTMEAMELASTHLTQGKK